MESNFEISHLTKFTQEDANAIRNLTSQLDSDFQELKDSDLEFIVNSPSTSLYVARQIGSDEIIGMITLVTYRIPYKMKGWVEDVVVDQNHRGQGIATKLMEHVIEEAKSKGVKSLNLTSNPKRESAHKIYEQFGFEKRDTNVYRKML